MATATEKELAELRAYRLDVVNRFAAVVRQRDAAEREVESQRAAREQERTYSKNLHDSLRDGYISIISMLMDRLTELGEPEGSDLLKAARDYLPESTIAFAPGQEPLIESGQQIESGDAVGIDEQGNLILIPHAFAQAIAGERLTKGGIVVFQNINGRLVAMNRPE
jgi:hypothetical protein